MARYCDSAQEGSIPNLVDRARALQQQGVLSPQSAVVAPSQVQPSVPRTPPSAAVLLNGYSASGAIRSGVLEADAANVTSARPAASAALNRGGGSYSAMFAASSVASTQALSAPRPNPVLAPAIVRSVGATGQTGSRFDLDDPQAPPSAANMSATPAPSALLLRPLAKPIPTAATSTSTAVAMPAVPSRPPPNVPGSSRAAEPPKATATPPAPVLVLPLSRSNLQYVVEMLGSAGDRTAQLKGLHFFGRSADIQVRRCHSTAVKYCIPSCCIVLFQLWHIPLCVLYSNSHSRLVFLLS